MQDLIVKAVQSHAVLYHAVLVALVGGLARIDSVIVFLLRFFPPEKINAELDRLEALAKARVNKDAQIKTPPPQPPTAA